MLIEYVKSFIDVSLELEEDINAYFKQDTYPKNQLVIETGKRVNHIYFLGKGTVRSFSIDKGKEINSWFYIDQNIFTSSFAFYGREASLENFETLDESIIYSISYDDYQLLLEKYPEFQKFGRLLAEIQIAYLDQYFRGYMFMSAKEKYDLLLSYIPDITNRVKLGHIASFLGISQETLSRIRNEI